MSPGSMKGKTWQEKRTHCVQGHEFNEENTRLYRGYRVCRACKREETAKLWRKKHPKLAMRRAKHQQMTMNVASPKQSKPDERRKRRQRAQELVTHLKQRPCVDCGVTYPPCAMDFDHLDEETKLDNVSELVQRGRSLAVILEEIEKCDLVCAVCHRIRTDRRFRSRRAAMAVPGRGR